MNEAIFIAVGAALLLAAVAFLVVPLLRPAGEPGTGDRNNVQVELFRDKVQELERDRAAGTIADSDYDEAKAELEREALQDLGQPAGGAARSTSNHRQKITAFAVAVVVSVTAVGLYARFGDVGAVEARSGAPLAQASTRDQIAFIRDHLAQLQERARANPKDEKTWTMLARVDMLLGRYDEAVDAFGHLRGIVGDRADVMTDQAEAMAMAAGGAFPDKARKQVEGVLAKDPNQPKALWLAGVAAASRHRNARARAYWERLLAQMPPGSGSAQRLRQQIASLAAAADSGAANTAGPNVKVTVALDPRLRNRFKPEDTVYVSARASSGAGPPLAVKRLQVRDLPLTVVLNDNLAVMPGRTLSSASSVSVTARVSRSGGAAPSAGDATGTIGPVTVGDGPAHQVTMDKLVE